MSLNANVRAEALIEALPYMQKFRGHLFVIKYGGSAMEDEHAIDRLLKDVVFLEAVGINPVVIHGKTVLIGQKLPPQREHGEDVDLGYVGEVTDVKLDEITQMVEREIVPVISPLARDAAGIVYNINADIAAGSVAGRLGATKLIYVSDVPGLMRDPADKSSLIPSVSTAQIEKLIADNIITGGMLPKVESALNALRQGVKKVHFIDGRTPHALLLEVFTNQGIGTEIVG